MRKSAGAVNNSSGNDIRDWTIRGLDELLVQFQTFSREVAEQKALLLWEALCDLENRHGANAFSGTYRWFYYNQHNTSFDAYFVRQLNEAPWIPDGNGNLVTPYSVVFDAIQPGWISNPFLMSKIKFKPPIIEALAREAGFDPEALDLLKSLGLTSTSDLKKRLGIEEPNSTNVTTRSTPIYEREEILDLWNDSDDESEYIPPASIVATNSHQEVKPPRNPVKSNIDENSYAKTSSGGPSRSSNTKQPLGKSRFVSYVAVEPDDESEADGISHETRMALEESAIQKILLNEIYLRRTSNNNPGFDLYVPGHDAQPVKFVEVKAMTGTLMDRPVSLSRTQFEFALRHGSRYWLYIVENAGDDTSRIIRIQNPAGKAQTFTFDHGWVHVGIID